MGTPSGVWGGAPTANDFGAFWTEMEASGTIILSTVCSFLTCYRIQLQSLNGLCRSDVSVLVAQLVERRPG